LLLLFVILAIGAALLVAICGMQIGLLRFWAGARNDWSSLLLDSFEL